MAPMRTRASASKDRDQSTSSIGLTRRDDDAQMPPARGSQDVEDFDMIQVANKISESACINNVQRHIIKLTFLSDKETL